MIRYSAAVRQVMVREWVRIAGRKNLYVLMIAVPLILFLVIGSIYQQRIVAELPVALLDMDHSELSRTIIRAVAANRTLKVVETLTNTEEIEEGFRAGRLQGAFLIPEGMEAQIKGGGSARLIVYRDHFNLVAGNMVLKEATTIGRMVSGGILQKKLAAKALGREQTLAIVNPISVDSRPLFNPAYNYANYLIPGLLPSLLQMVVMLTAVLVIAVEYQEGTLAELFTAAGGRVSALLIGKSLPHLLIHAAAALGLIGVLFPLLDIPVAGSVWLLLGMMMLFTAASFFLGLLISSLVHNPMLATEAAVFINTPAFMFSGYTYPLWGMPRVHQLFAQIMPFTHFLTAFIKIYQMGAPLRFLGREITLLSLFTLGAAAGSWLLLRHRCRQLQCLPVDQSKVLPAAGGRS